MSSINNPRIVRAWTMYDWANSVYSLSISSAIFPAFFEEKTKKLGELKFLGFSFINTALYTYALSAAFLIITLFIPLLSGISDYGGVRKPFMRFFIILGSIGCSALFWFQGENYLYGLGCFMLASIGWAGSLVFYNSYLPEIVSPDRFDKTSAKGYTMGYIGSVLMLLINLVMIMKKEWFGFGEGIAAIQYGFLLVGIWWLGWSFWPLMVLPKGISSGNKITGAILLKGYSEISKVFKQVLKMKPLLIYLAAFFIYTMGVQTIIYVAALFGKNELKLESTTMLITILLIQLVGIAGAYFFAWIADKKGNKFSLATTLLIWVLVCVCAFMVQPHQPGQFFALACLVGTVMGGIQSLSRATFAKLIPGDQDNTSFFSFYEVTEKLAMVLGTFAFGLVNQITGNMRSSILMLMMFFIIGFFILMLVKSPKLKALNK